MESDLNQDLKTGLNYTLGLAYNKTGNVNDSIAALKQAIQAGEGVEKEQTKGIVFAAHRELARVYGAAEQYEEAVEEYKFLAENSLTDSEKTDANFWLARTYEDNLQDYENAVMFYDKVKELDTSDILTAQSLYYSGVVYSKHLKDDEKALSLFQELVAGYSTHEDSNVQMMVTDANLRIPELLVAMGKFDDAVARAREVRDATLAGDDKEEKTNAQYSLAYLLGEQAGGAAESGMSDPELSREAATEYGKVYEVAKPLGEASDETKALVSASLYNAGYLLYGLGEYEDFENAVKYFEYFIVDFPKSENYSAALEYLGFASFEMARLKADLGRFVKASEYFLRFAREFPSHDDAAVAQFQGGEGYFAVGGGRSGNAEDSADPGERAREMALATDAYRKATSAYRGVADKYPDSEYAPDALYAMAAGHGYIAEALTDPAEKQKETDKMNAAYKELSEKYPQSEHAAAAFLSVANEYYNQASVPGVSADEKTNLYRLSLESYRQALQVPGIDSRTRMTVEAYARETEELLAMDTYNVGAALVPLDDVELRKANAPKAIPYFEEVIEMLPDTDYADLSHVQLGMCYEYLEQWENAESAYGELIQKYTDETGNPVTPFSENVVQAVRYARKRKGELMAYRLSISIQQQSGD